MMSYLEGRPSVLSRQDTANATTPSAVKKAVAEEVEESPESFEVVSAGPNAPKVEVVTVDGRVDRIQITTQGGEYIELRCLYS